MEKEKALEYLQDRCREILNDATAMQRWGSDRLSDLAFVKVKANHKLQRIIRESDSYQAFEKSYYEHSEYLFNIIPQYVDNRLIGLSELSGYYLSSLRQFHSELTVKGFLK